MLVSATMVRDGSHFGYSLQTFLSCRFREVERNRKTASLIALSALIIYIENSFVLALIRSLEKVQEKEARHKIGLVSVRYGKKRRQIFFVFN